MRKVLTCLAIFALCAAYPIAGNAQLPDSLSLPSISKKYFESLSSDAKQLEEKPDKKSEKDLLQFQKQEQKLKQNLSTDLLTAEKFFADSVPSFPFLRMIFG